MLERAAKVLHWYVCDHCLGRQFGKLLSGYDNEERGRMLRAMAAMSIDEENSGIKETQNAKKILHKGNDNMHKAVKLALYLAS